MLQLNKAGLGCLGAIVLVVCAFVVAFDVLLIGGLMRQNIAQRTYIPVQAEVLGSRVESSYSSGGSSGGTTHRAVIEYAYEVGGTRYENDRYSFVQFSTSDRHPARAIVDTHPVGTEITVYHDPDNPGESVIDLTSSGFPHLLVLFMTPFNCLAIGVVRVWLFAFRNRNKTPEEAALSPMIVSESTSKVVLRDQRWGLVTIYLVALGASAFVATFVVALGYGGFGAAQEPVWIGVLVCGVLAAIITARKAAAQAQSVSKLVIDYDRGTFERLDGSGAHPVTSIDTLKVVSTPKAKSKKKNREAWYTHEYAAVLSGGERVKLLTSMGHKDQRKPVKNWLASKLALSGS